MTAYGFAFSGVGVNLTGAGEPEHLRSLRVSADFFRTLGVQPVLGRSFTEDEDRPGGPNAVVLSYALWLSSSISSDCNQRRHERDFLEHAH